MGSGWQAGDSAMIVKHRETMVSNRRQKHENNSLELHKGNKTLQ